MKIQELSALELLEVVRAGALSVTEVARAYVSRIAAMDPTLHAWAHFDADQVMASAARLDAATRRGRLHGLPVAVKDVMDTADSPTSYGSPLYSGHRPAADAAVVAHLREEGALILGKTVTTEFAYFRPGATANPVDPRHTPGGSSSGSAAAVASFMAPLGLGSQTAASLIRPASYCGVVGFKPSFGRYSLAGIKGLAPSLDTLGWMARDVDDVHLLTRVLARREPERLVATDLRGVRIAIVRTAQWDHAQTDTREALATAAACFAGAGAQVFELELPPLFDGMADAHAELMAFEAASSLAHEYRTGRAQLSDQLRSLIERGRALDEAVWLRHWRTASDGRRALRAVFEDMDVILTPSAPGAAPRGLDATGDPVFSRMWTLLHCPCLTLPGINNADGLPVGVQLVGLPMDDDRLLSIGKACLAVLASMPA